MPLDVTDAHICRAFAKWHWLSIDLKRRFEDFPAYYDRYLNDEDKKWLSNMFKEYKKVSP